jgi:peptidoglycan/xylan/chitin deacetylase (PgdA/CDA1 family)
MDLGNHTARHVAIDAQTPEAWEEDVRRCQRHLGQRLAHRARFFRFPMLQQGRTVARRDAALAALRRLGHEHAPVSVDTADWVLIHAYARALRAADGSAARQIGAAFVTHILDAVRHYRALARARVGREVQQILLLHASALAADHLDQLLGALRREGLAFVPLAEALRDPVYQRPDGYAGPIGLSWLHRLAPAQPRAWRWDQEHERDLARRFGPPPP